VSLRTRLALIVAAVVAAVVGLGSFVQVRVFEWRAESGLRATALGVAEGLAAEIAALPGEPSQTELHDRIERRASSSAIDTVAVLFRSPDGTERFATSTAGVTGREARLLRAACQSARVVWDESERSGVLIALPIYRVAPARAAVAVGVSFDVLHALVQRERWFSLLFAVSAVAAVTLLVSVLVRPYVHAPIEAMLDTMARAGAGDLAARAPKPLGDELGRLAAGLNELLDRTQSLNMSLQERIDEATRELRKSNDDLVSSYQRMFSLREQLARAEQTAAAGQTAANLAHQIGTPLNLISGYVQMMLEEAGDARQADRLRSVQEQIRKVTGHIRATLDHVRRPPLSKDPVFPAAMLRRIFDVSRPRLNAAGITLALDVADHLPWLLGDPVQLELALLNLVNNGLDAMPEGGTLTVSARAVDTRTRIEVTDTGSGISAELLPRIFDPWVTTKPVGRGTGLGLSITREVIVAHGGTIHAENVPGAGARFVVELPGKTGAPAIHEV
jgi:signal transduction histidine kinase